MKSPAALALVVALFGATAADAAQNRCGWLVNPTPGNWWLTDRDGTWILATQGIEASDDVMLNLPQFDDRQYVATNGNYGYGCACLSVDLDPTGKEIVKVHRGSSIALSRCRNDRALPPPG